MTASVDNVSIIRKGQSWGLIRLNEILRDGRHHLPFDLTNKKASLHDSYPPAVIYGILPLIYAWPPRGYTI
jgi:hypothetical protein